MEILEERQSCWPVLAATALAAGIGSATAIYTVIDAVLIKPVPWRHSERVRPVQRAAGQYEQRGVGLDFLAGSRGLPAKKPVASMRLECFYRESSSLTSPGQPQHLTGVGVTPSFAREPRRLASGRALVWRDGKTNRAT